MTDLADRVRRWRHDLHRIPETGLREHRAGDYLAATALAVTAARLTVGEDLLDADTAPWTASEDFGAFAEVVPACFALLGNGERLGAGGTPLHSPDDDFNDDVLDTGVACYVNLVRTALPVTGAR